VLRGTDRRGMDDAKQILQQRLFVGATPKIASYSGRGPLRRWLRVVVGRMLLEVLHAREPLADDWEIAALPVATDNPELAYLKARYRAEYKQAFADALAQLGDRDRTVLAQYHVDGLTIDELGAMYSVHRVTASRWVLKAEAMVRDCVLAVLRVRLGLSTADLREVTQLVRSQLSLSLARTLGPRPPGSDF
jgi:RNA polymerase sigma-70 factor (ECF subfamily)